VNSRVALAGQIPLIPASLTLPADDYAHQSILALQHVQRIRDVLRSKNSTGGGWEGWVEGCTAWYVNVPGKSNGLETVRHAWRLWSERVGPFHLLLGSSEGDVVLIQQEGCGDAPVLFVQAEELPKGALVEFQVNFHTGRPGVGASCSNAEEEDDDNDDDDVELEAVYSSYDEKGVRWESCKTNSEGQGRRSMVFLRGKLPLAPRILTDTSRYHQHRNSWSIASLHGRSERQSLSPQIHTNSR
jgi:diphthine-ammonia ligase